MTKASFVKLTLLAIASLAVLVGLGSWQLNRLAWKQDLVNKVESRANAEPVPLAAALQQWSQTGDVEYLRVGLSGSFLHEKERHLYTVVRGRPGWRIFTPLETADGRLVMLDRGFVPEPFKEPERRKSGQIDGPVTLTGLARAPERKGRFTPVNDPDRNMWYWRDLEGMVASVSNRAETERFYPFFVEAEATNVPGGWPQGGVTRLKLANRHLEYALTWFGLAMALASIYAVIVWRWRKYGHFA